MSQNMAFPVQDEVFMSEFQQNINPERRNPMQKKFALPHVFLIIIFSFFFAVSGWTAPSPAISITGSVRQPLNLTLEDLQKLETVTVRLNEVTRDHQYNGAFYYRGIPLKTLLELALCSKRRNGFFQTH